MSDHWKVLSFRNLNVDKPFIKIIVFLDFCEELWFVVLGVEWVGFFEWNSVGVLEVCSPDFAPLCLFLKKYLLLKSDK